MRAALAALLLCACRSPGPAVSRAAEGAPASNAPRLQTADAPAAAPTEDTMKITDEVKACIDRWIKKHGLNPYGDPPDTAYAGGTPLFDESTGKRTDRYEYILARHPELKECKGDGP